MYIPGMESSSATAAPSSGAPLPGRASPPPARSGERPDGSRPETEHGIRAPRGVGAAGLPPRVHRASRPPRRRPPGCAGRKARRSSPRRTDDVDVPGSPTRGARRPPRSAPRPPAQAPGAERSSRLVPARDRRTRTSAPSTARRTAPRSASASPPGAGAQARPRPPRRRPPQPLGGVQRPRRGGAPPRAGSATTVLSRRLTPTRWPPPPRPARPRRSAAITAFTGDPGAKSGPACSPGARRRVAVSSDCTTRPSPSHRR